MIFYEKKKKYILWNIKVEFFKAAIIFLFFL